jgi:hypothetical protein
MLDNVLAIHSERESAGELEEGSLETVASA